jgi:hypothetical protein
VHVDDEMLRGEMKNFDSLIFSDIKKTPGTSSDGPGELST